MHCFNSLPPELHLEIFFFLSASEVMKIRQVCKQWAALIDNEFKFKRLLCRQLAEPDDYRDSYWDFQFVCIRSFLNYTSSDRKFRRVKYLDAELRPYFHQWGDAYEFLSSFEALEEASVYLYFRCSPAEEIQETFVISSNGLEKATFHFGFDLSSDVNVLLNLPSLFCLSLDSLHPVTIGHPDKLQLLVLNDLFDADLDFSEFVNLEIIYIDKRNVPKIPANFIEMLPSLRELHFDQFYLFDWVDRIHSFKRLPIEEAHSMKRSSVQAKPKIFYLGSEIGLDQLASNYRMHSTDLEQLISWLRKSSLGRELRF